MAEKKIFVGIYENGMPIHLPLNPGDTIVNASGREIATYTETGLVPDNRLPPLAIKDTFVVGSETEMLLLTAQTGDIAIRTDISATFILKGENSSELLDWRELATPIDTILSVFGRTGNINAEYGDYNATQIVFNPSQVLNATDVQGAIEYLAVFKSDIDHTHVKSQITDFAHTHTKSEITDFVHTHTKSEITDFAHSHELSDLIGFENHTHVKSQITDFEHTHSQDESHFNVDTDSSDESIHHTLGTSEFQAAKGNHLHNPLDIGAIPISFMGVGNGVATLGADGKLKDDQIPKLSITDTFPVASESEMLALDADQGDIAIRADIRKCFILKNRFPTLLSSWLEMIIPLDVLLSWNGRLGHITPEFGDYSADLISIQQYPPNIQTTNVRDAIYSLADKIHNPNTDRFLSNQITKKIYIDPSNIDNYSPNGTITKPYKNFSSALNGIQSLLFTNVTFILNPCELVENILINLNGCIIDIESSGTSSKITGNIEIAGDSLISISNLKLDGTLTNSSPNLKINNCEIRRISNSSIITINDSIIQGNNNELPLITNSGSCLIFSSRIMNQGQKFTILSTNGNLSIFNSIMINHNVFPVVLSSETELFIESSVLQTNGGLVLEIQNTTKSLLNNIHVNGNIELNNQSCRIGIINNHANSSIFNDTNAVYILDQRYYTRAIIDHKLLNLSNPNTNTLYVSKIGSDVTGNGSFALPFLTLKAALNSITDASNLNRYTINVLAGRFVEENDLTLKDFVNIIGLSKESTIISKANNTPIEYFCSNTFMTIKDITFGSTGVHITKVGDLKCEINFESCKIEGYGSLKYIGTNSETKMASDFLTVSQTCKFPHIYAKNVNLIAHHTIVEKTIVLIGYMNSLLVGIHVGLTITVDNQGIINEDFSNVRIDNPSMPNQLNQLILIGSTELHKNVIYLDQSSGIYYDCTNSNIINSKNLQSAIKTLDTHAHIKDTDKYLTTQRTNIIYVDNMRTDIYAANGSITKPYKTISEALLQTDNRSVLHVAPGLYQENVTCYNSIDIRGIGVRKVTIKGTVTFNNQYNNLENIHINGNVYINDITKMYRCDITGVVHMSIPHAYGYAEFHECTLLSNNEHPPLKVDTKGKLTILNSRIEGRDNTNCTIFHSFGILRILDSYVYGNSNGFPVIDSNLHSVNSILKIHNTELVHGSPETNDTIKAFNTATDCNPNILTNVVSTGSIRTELTPTHIDGLVFHISGNLHGAHHYFRGSNVIKNESTVPGVNVSDALNSLGEISGYVRPSTPTPGKLFFDLNLQRPIWWNPLINNWVDVHGVVK